VSELTIQRTKARSTGRYTAALTGNVMSRDVEPARPRSRPTMRGWSASKALGDAGTRVSRFLLVDDRVPAMLRDLAAASRPGPVRPSPGASSGSPSGRSSTSRSASFQLRSIANGCAGPRSPVRTGEPRPNVWNVPNGYDG
jgi:hypothetical protein